MEDVCLIDESIATALVTEPLKQSLIEADSLELVAGLRAEAVAERGAYALLGSVDAALLLASHSVVTDFALVSGHSGPYALWTPTRPDEIDNVPVALDGVSRTAEAIARATIHHFFGITVAGWERDTGEGQAVVREGAGALRAAELGELNDLVRAWYVLTNFPFATHLLVVPKALTEQPERVAALVRTLQQALDAGIEHRREIRRDLTNEFDLDRDKLVDFQNDQKHTLSKSARKAWLDLLRRVQRPLRLQESPRPDFVTLGTEEG
ncbi:MAG TPA: MqnA/MqnD/SBP family protein [Thermomicrobiaceae bacterium]|nr:MqnA/MqnD/SBP family protein [Thermomicrobiaceae bacterium]